MKMNGRTVQERCGGGNELGVFEEQQEVKACWWQECYAQVLGLGGRWPSWVEPSSGARSLESFQQGLGASHQWP